MKNDSLSLKEVLTISAISLLSTPIGYLIITAPPGWWMK